jgi:hypothetical protein
VAVKVHESVAVPEPPVMLDGVTVQAELSAVRATLPVKPFSGVTVIVDVPAVLTTTVTVAGLAEIVKSGAGVIVKATVAECDNEPLVPVTVTVTDPVLVKVQDRVEVPVPPVTEVGVRVQAVLSEVRATLPVKLLRGVMVIVEVPAVFTITLTVLGLVAIVKSGGLFTVYAMVAEWESEPLVPVTVTVTVSAAVKVQDRVEVPVPPVILAGVRVHAAEVSEARATVPVNPFKGETVITELPATPTVVVTLVGLAVRAKSGAAVTVIVPEVPELPLWDESPVYVPVTVKLPAATPVIVTVQVPEVRLQLAATVPTVVSDEVKLTLPDGLLAGVVVSETVTEQEPVRPTATEAEQETAVEVESLTTVIVPDVPELPLWAVSPA